MSRNQIVTRVSVAVAYAILGTGLAIVVLIVGAGIAMALAGGRPQMVYTWSTDGSSQQSLAVVQRVPVSSVAEGTMVVLEDSVGRILQRVESIDRSAGSTRVLLAGGTADPGGREPIVLHGQVSVAKLSLPAAGRVLDLLGRPLAGLALALLALSPLVAISDRTRIRTAIVTS